MTDVSHVDLPVRPWSDEEEEALGGDSFVDPISLTANDSSMDPIALTESDHQEMINLESGEHALHELGMVGGYTDQITGRVKDVRNAAWRRRLRISLPSFLCAILCFSIAAPLQVILRSSGGYGDVVLYSLTMFLICLGMLSCLITLLPSDRRAVPCVAFSLGALMFVIQCLLLSKIVTTWFRDLFDTGCVMSMWDEGTYEGTGEEMGTGPCLATLVLCGGEVLIVLCGNWFTVIHRFFLLCTLKRSECRKMLLSIWLHTRVVASCIAGNSVIRAFVALLFPQYISFIEEVSINWPWLVLAVLCHPRLAFRLRVQSWLSSFGEGISVAAGVAELLGDESVEKLIAKAKNSLYYISADVLTREDMAQNTPDPALSRFVQKGSLGRIDAFVSHSWRDDPDAKWHSLQKWIADFKEKRGRAPTLWIDKYCIDQKNIEESLMCLPVYLSGCRQMLVLCGESYLQRLWCLVEIFTFATMLGQGALTEVRYLNQGSHVDSQPLGSLRAALQRFDSRAAQCTNEYDTHRLRAVIEASDLGKDGMAELLKSIFDSGRPSVRFSYHSTTK